MSSFLWFKNLCILFNRVFINVESSDLISFDLDVNFIIHRIITDSNCILLLLQVTIKQATGLPLSLSNFVFCQYVFWNHPDSIVVPPIVDREYSVSHTSGRDSMTFKFDHTQDFVVPITEEFLEHCSGDQSFSH